MIRKCKAGDSGLRGVTYTLHERGLMLIWSTSYQTKPNHKTDGKRQRSMTGARMAQVIFIKESDLEG